MHHLLFQQVFDHKKLPIKSHVPTMMRDTLDVFQPYVIYKNISGQIRWHCDNSYAKYLSLIFRARDDYETKTNVLI